MGCVTSHERDSALEEEALRTHNQMRTRHRAPQLQLDDALCRDAARYAAKLAGSRKLQHARPRNRSYKGSVCGENLASKQGTAPCKLTGAEASRMWYDEIQQYSFASPKFGSNTGHFTQLVWKDSRLLGIGVCTKRMRNGTDSCVVVARYHPAGNVQGQFKENVLQ